ncbi:MAG: hypothetical protein ACLTAN_02360 [Christensenellaceae bacterium]
MEDYKDQRKKAIKKTRFMCLVAIAIGAVLVGIGMLLHGKAQAFGVVIGLIGLVCVATGVYVSFSEVQRIKRLFCSKCGYAYTIECEESQRSESDDGKKVYAYETFDCTCENCGNETSFTKKFLVASVDDKGRVTSYNVEKKVKDYIKFKF